MTRHEAASPTVVLVHGAFADQSYWWWVARELEDRGVRAVVRPNPLEGLDADAAYIARLADRVRGPVLLVGHSYGGAVISVAGAAASNVVGLVYVAAFILDTGESFGDVLAKFPATRHGTDGSKVRRAGGNRADVRLSLLPEPAPSQGSSEAADLGPGHDSFTQPLIASIFEAQAAAAAWRTLPSWAIVATGDKAIHPDAQRHMARRAGANAVEVDAAHSIAVSDPMVVVLQILRAVDASAIVGAAPPGLRAGARGGHSDTTDEGLALAT